MNDTETKAPTDPAPAPPCMLHDHVPGAACPACVEAERTDPRGLSGLKVGDVCRAVICGSLVREGRYLGHGKALFVYAQEGDLGVLPALPPVGGEGLGWLADDDEVAEWAAKVAAGGGTEEL